MLDFVQQLVSGVALGCVYGLIALGFVLVYKATEVVNFAQGDMMMLGGFFAFTFIGMMGLNYWIGFAGASSRWRCSACWRSGSWCGRSSAIRNSPSSWRPSASATSCARSPA